MSRENAVRNNGDKRTILVISFSPLNRDPRVRRQLNSLRKAGYRVTAAGLSDPCMAGVAWWPVRGESKTMAKKAVAALMLKLKMFETYYWKSGHVMSLLHQWERNAQPSFDLVIANDVDAVPVSLKIARGAPVYADLHEYAPEEMGGRAWRFFFSAYRKWLCAVYLPQVAKTSTVCEGVADLYRRHFGISPSVIYNAPKLSVLEPSAASPQCMRLVHHGGASPNRQLERMIDALGLLGREYELNFYLMAHHAFQKQYVQSLKKRADECNAKVIFHEPVETERIPDEINQYDMGIYILPPESTNDRLALPNKFFEFVQARLAIAIGPSPEMARLVRQYDLGVVADDFSAEALAAAISSMDIERIRQCKRNADKAARELCYDAQEPAFLETVCTLVNR